MNAGDLYTMERPDAPGAGSLGPEQRGFSTTSCTDSVLSDTSCPPSYDPFLPSSVFGAGDVPPFDSAANLLSSDIKNETSSWDTHDSLSIDLGRVSSLTLGTPISQGRHNVTEQPHPYPSPQSVQPLELPPQSYSPLHSPSQPQPQASAPAPAPAPPHSVHTIPFTTSPIPQTPCAPRRHGSNHSSIASSADEFSHPSDVQNMSPYQASLPPNASTTGSIPMTPLTQSDRTSRHTADLSTSSYASLATPEYGPPTGPRFSSVPDVFSPYIPPPDLSAYRTAAPETSPTPRKSCTLPVYMESIPGTPDVTSTPHPLCMPPMPPTSAGPMTSPGGQILLDDPFVPMPYYTSAPTSTLPPPTPTPAPAPPPPTAPSGPSSSMPHRSHPQPPPHPYAQPHASLHNILPMEHGNGLPQHAPPMMSRVLSAPVGPLWPHESPGPPIPYTPIQERSLPTSPASNGGYALPVSSVAMARKCFTPYSKQNSIYSWPYHEMEYYSSSMSASRSMGSLGSPLPTSPATPSGPSRRGSQMSHSISMPGDQIPALLDLERPSPSRQRGRNPGPPPLVVSSADKLHVCHCGRRFKRMEHLKRHTRTHTQERPHKCPVASCGKSFGRTDNLAQHLKTHFRPAGLAGRSSELAPLKDNTPATHMRNDPFAAAAAAASAAAAAAAAASTSSTTTVPLPEHDKIKQED